MDLQTTRPPNLRQLRLFKLLHEGASIRAAGRQLSISQPAATLRLASLEKYYQRTLFERRPDGLAATRHADALYARIRAAFGLIDEAVAVARGARMPLASLSTTLNRLTVSQLLSLVSIDRYEGFSNAAGHSGLNKSSIHRSLAELEAALGIELVHREGARATTTPQGKLVARLFNLALGEIRLGEAAVHEVDGVLAAPINVGAARIVSQEVLPRAILRCSREMPSVRFEVRLEDHETLLHELRSGALDLVFTTFRPLDSPDLVVEQLFESNLRIICRAGHPLAGLGAVSAAHLARFPWILGMDPASSAARHWRDLFEREDLAPPVPWVRTSLPAMVQALLRETDGLALEIRSVRHAERGTCDLVALSKSIPDSERHVWLAYRRHWQSTKAHEAFLEAVRAIAAKV
ncbi:LysR substrate-binding domain-containing protein [Bosea sp. F3-2]|uniref:LysR substrate-binding domain-containing protein n=1 Tax=Bosea sp. F3-2 TaxID=2599640 RepID=UPI0016558DB9|nr:LysR substrate-binding domain-containing protein [Bosea sp. F3-2]